MSHYSQKSDDDIDPDDDEDGHALNENAARRPKVHEQDDGRFARADDHSLDRNPQQHNERTRRMLTSPRPQDVLCGKGKAVFEHPGNHHFRRFIAANMALYKQNASKASRNRLICFLTDQMLDSGTRFLRKSDDAWHTTNSSNVEEEEWYVLNLKESRTKVGQSLRDASRESRGATAGVGVSGGGRAGRVVLDAATRVVAGCDSGGVLDPRIAAAGGAPPIIPPGSMNVAMMTEEERQILVQQMPAVPPPPPAAAAASSFAGSRDNHDRSSFIQAALWASLLSQQQQRQREGQRVVAGPTPTIPANNSSSSNNNNNSGIAMLQQSSNERSYHYQSSPNHMHPLRHVDERESVQGEAGTAVAAQLPLAATSSGSAASSSNSFFLGRITPSSSWPQERKGMSHRASSKRSIDSIMSPGDGDCTATPRGDHHHVARIGGKDEEHPLPSFSSAVVGEESLPSSSLSLDRKGTRPCHTEENFATPMVLSPSMENHGDMGMMRESILSSSAVPTTRQEQDPTMSTKQTAPGEDHDNGYFFSVVQSLAKKNENNPTQEEPRLQRRAARTRSEESVDDKNDDDDEEDREMKKPPAVLSSPSSAILPARAISTPPPAFIPRSDTVLGIAGTDGAATLLTQEEGITATTRRGGGSISRARSWTGSARHPREKESYFMEPIQQQSAARPRPTERTSSFGWGDEHFSFFASSSSPGRENHDDNGDGDGGDLRSISGTFSSSPSSSGDEEEDERE